MTHPLTNNVCDQITDELSIFSVEDCMRYAADWQLEQVIDWLRSMNEHEYLYTYIVDPQLDKDELIADLKKAMRPTQEDN